MRDATALDFCAALGHAPRAGLRRERSRQERHRLGRLEAGRVDHTQLLRPDGLRLGGDFAVSSSLHKNKLLLDEDRQRVEPGHDRAARVWCQFTRFPSRLAAGLTPAQLDRALGRVGDGAANDGVILAEGNDRLGGEHRWRLLAQHEGVQLATAGRLEDHAQVAVVAALDEFIPADIATRRLGVSGGIDCCCAVELAVDRDTARRHGTSILERRDIPQRE